MSQFFTVVISMLFMAPLASAKTIELTLVLDPFTRASTELSIGEEKDCKDRRTGAVTIRECQLIDSNFKMSKGGTDIDVEIDRSLSVVTIYNDVKFTETYYTGQYEVDGVEINTSVVLRDIDGVTHKGFLILNETQKFVLLPK